MLALIAVVLIATYPVLATRVARRGRGALLLLAGVTLLIIGAAAAVVGVQYDVPSVSRLVLHVWALTAPVVLVPTMLLSLRRAASWGAGAALGIALAGALVGGIAGWVIVIYGLRVW